MAGAGYSPGSECAGQSPEGFTPGENDRLDGLYRGCVKRQLGTGPSAVLAVYCRNDNRSF